MKRIYIFLMQSFLFGGAVLSAQQNSNDTILTREMVIEKSYNPIVRDAQKISRMPVVETPIANKTKVHYAGGNTTYQLNDELSPLKVGQVNTSYLFSKQKGYLDLGLGNYWNVKGDFGYRFIDTSKDIFGIELRHTSSNGKLSPMQSELPKVRRKINDNYANLYYNHDFSNFVFRTNFSFDYNRFNYYGIEPSFVTYNPSLPNQTEKRFSLQCSAITLKDEEWNYKVLFGYNGYDQSLLDFFEHNIDLTMGLSKRMSDSWRFATDVETDLLFYSNADKEIAKYDNHGIVRFHPYMEFLSNNQISLKLGVHTDFSYGETPHVGIAPDIRFNWNFAKNFSLYSELTGGLHQCSVNELSRNYRYYLANDSFKNSYTIANWRLGFRSTPFAGFWFDIYGSMAYTKDEMFLQSALSLSQATDQSYAALNVLNAYLNNAFQYNFGVKMKYTYGQLLDMGLTLQKNKWDLKGSAIPSYKPGFEADLNILLKPMDHLSFGVDYQMQSDRKALVTVSNLDTNSTLTHSLKDIHQLNVRANWIINRTFTVSASVNNILCRKQEVYYQMPFEGFNFLAGGTIRF